MKLPVLFVLLCCLASASSIHVAYDYPLLNGVGGSNLGNQSYSQALGMDFVVNTPITIFALGAFDSGQDGLQSQITVSLYDVTDTSAPLASLILNVGDPLQAAIDSGRYLDLPTPLSLPAGFHGTIVAYGYSTSELNGNRNVDSSFNPAILDTAGGAVTYLSSSPYGGSGYPNTPFSGFNNEFGAGSFTFSVTTVPEPASVILAGIGLLAASFFFRKKR